MKYIQLLSSFYRCGNCCERVLGPWTAVPSRQQLAWLQVCMDIQELTLENSLCRYFKALDTDVKDPGSDSPEYSALATSKSPTQRYFLRNVQGAGKMCHFCKSLYKQLCQTAFMTLTSYSEEIILNNKKILKYVHLPPLAIRLGRYF